MDAYLLIQFVFLPFLIFGNLFKSVQGGLCWASMDRNGRCTELRAASMSREECCASGAASTAWSAEDLDPGTLFFWRVLGGGVLCSGCRETCSGVQCGPGKKCVDRGGRPKCVCAPDCRNGGGGGGLSASYARTHRAGTAMLRHQHPVPHKAGSPVCGTDGKSYRTLCRLKKRACRRKNSALTVAYYGQCQSTCERIRCGSGRHCLVDQNMTPHCVRCTTRVCAPVLATASPDGTPVTSRNERHVCGADGVTYASACHLREAACRKGRAIPIAYKGRCKNTATCGTVRCKDRQVCLSEPQTGAPRCVTCGYKCRGKARGQARGQAHGQARAPGSRGRSARRDHPPRSGPPLCGTNNLTYHSWCHMLRDACATGYVIETRHAGACEATKGSNLGKHSALGLLHDVPKIA